MCRRYYTTTLCYRRYASWYKDKMGCYELFHHWELYFKLHAVRGVGLDINRNKRGQTSRTAVGAEVQTSCDIVASSSSPDIVLVNLCRWWIDVHLEQKRNFDRSLRLCRTLSCNINLLLYENLS